MGRNAIQLQFGLLETLFDLFGALEALFRLEHVIGGLGTDRAGAFCISQEVREVLGSVLSAFHAGMKTSLCHKEYVI